MNNFRTRKEAKEDIESILKTEEDFFKWFSEMSVDYRQKEYHYLIEPYPHRPFFLKFEKEFDYDPKQRKEFSYQFFPFPEQIHYSEIKLIDGNLYFPWAIKDDRLLILNSNCNIFFHYSTNPKVWEWDWQRIVDSAYFIENFKGIEIGIEYKKEIIDDVINSLRKFNLKYTIKTNSKKFNGNFILLRLNKKNYIKFRKFQLYLSNTYNIRSYYIYEEIRSWDYDTPEFIIA